MPDMMNINISNHSYLIKSNAVALHINANGKYIAIKDKIPLKLGKKALLNLFLSVKNKYNV
jgi:hypothetical protein